MKRILFWLGLLLALVLLVAMRVPLLRCEPYIPGTPLLYDERDYMAGANSMAAGNTLSDTIQPWLRAPGTAWLLLTTAQLRGLPIELAACDFQRVQIGLWAIILLGIAGIAAVLFDRRVALIAAFMVAVLPVGLAVTWMVHADTLFIAAEVACVWALVMYTRFGGVGWVVLAGLLAGAATLTRSTLVPLLPLFALWLGAAAWRLRGGTWPAHWGDLRGWLRGTRWPGWLRALLPALLFLGITLAVVTPWGLRNQRLYGSFIISDTTGAVNLFDNNAPPTGVNSFTAIRESSDNPAERQSFASRRAREVILADPLRFVAKVIGTGWFAWGPEEFPETLNFYVVITELPLVGSLLAQLKVLLWFAMPLALLGLVLAPLARPAERDYRLVTLAIMLLYTAMIGATHLEDRYRLPYVLLWLPYAAWCLGHPRLLVRALRRPLGLAAGVAVLALVLSFVPLLGSFERANLEALAHYGRGLVRERTSDLEGALADMQAAAAAQPRLTEALVGAARLQAELGQTAAAEQSLRAALAQAASLGARAPADATVVLQELLRQQGRTEEAATLDSGLGMRARDRAEALAWARLGSAQSSLAIGGDDLGQLRGFYTADRSGLRWSKPEAQIRLAGEGSYACLEANAARPAGDAAPALTLRASAGGQSATTTLHLPRTGWAWLCAPVPEHAPSQVVTLDLATSAYIPFAEGQRDDARILGVALRHAELRSGTLPLDPGSGLLLNSPPASVGEGSFSLLGINPTVAAQPGGTAELLLWWRGAAPPANTFTFVHLLDQNGQKVAEYNAPILGGDLSAWNASAPVPEQAALVLPADLPPGEYQLLGGAFDVTSGAQLAHTELGTLTVAP